VGHSIGEVAAAQVAGLLSLEDAIIVVCERGRLMQEATGLGRMASVELDETTAVELINSYEGRLSLAACNGPTTSVISGEAEAMNSAVDELSARGIECRMLTGNYAFHSQQMDGFAERLVSVLSEIKTSSAQLPIYSTLSGREAVASDYDASYWGRQMCMTVRFNEAVEAALSAGHAAFLEVGPHPVLCAATLQIARRSAPETTATEPVVIGSLRRSMDESEQLLNGLSQLYVNGLTPKWQEVNRGGRSVALPTYAWQRQRYWVNPSPGNGHVHFVPGAFGTNGQRVHKLLGHHSTLASGGTHLWEAVLDRQHLPYLVDHQIQGATVLPGTAYLEMA
jgi:acyl transferase domain-containing protein